MGQNLDALIKEAKAAWDREDGKAYTALRAQISHSEKTAFSSLTERYAA